MCHRLKPTEVTSMLLSQDAKFRWEPSKNRIVRFDDFTDELAAKFSVVAWDVDPKVANQSKVELFTLCSGPNLRDFINTTISSQPDILFDDLVRCVRKMLVKSTPPLVQLAKLMANRQGRCESFDVFYNRVHEDAKSICWETLDTSNIRNVVIATVLASNSNNPYVKGHCLSVRDVNTIKLEDIKSTAQEYEAKNPLPSTFPSQTGQSLFGGGNSNALFGSGHSNMAPAFGSSHSGSGFAFGSSHTNTAPSFGNSMSSFGSSSTGNDSSTNSSFNFGSASTAPTSFEEQRAGVFGSASAATPFGSSRSRNIFMSNRPGPNVETGNGTDLRTQTEEQGPKRQRSSESTDKKDNV